MRKLFLFVSLIALATASNWQTEYNYESIVPKVAESSHQVHQPAQISTVHDEGTKKHFYYFNAPEEHIYQHEVQKSVPIQSHTKKNLQVIFIQPPEQKIHRKVVQHLTPNVVDEKTHIYVLNKEPNHAAISKHTQIIQQATVHHHKPEVHFLKYRTPADAHNIQQSIIQQYGGKPSEVIHIGNGGTVNFASTGIKYHPHSDLTVSREYLAPKPAVTSVDNNYAKNFLPSGTDVVPGSSYLPPVLR